MILNWLILGVVYTRLLQSEPVEFLAEIFSTLFLAPLIICIEYHVISDGRIWKTLNFEETEVLLWGFYIMESMNTLQLCEISVIRIQKLESSLALKFKDCARLYVRRWQCQGDKERQRNSTEHWGGQAGCSKIAKCSVQTSVVAAQSWQKVKLIFTRCANKYRWDAIIAIVIIMSPPVVCLGLSCSDRVLTLSAVRELDTWLATCVQGLFCIRRSSELDSDCSLCTTQSKNQVLGHEVVVWTWLHR